MTDPLTKAAPGDSAASAKSKPIIYACSGCSDAGELADRVARTLTERGVGEMSCLAGVAGRVKPLLQKAQKAEQIVVVDGCPLNCARHTLLQAGITRFKHVGLHEIGHRKGNCPVSDARVEDASITVEKIVTEVEPERTADPAENAPTLSR
jgi:uncharacterized metal-binding protein